MRDLYIGHQMSEPKIPRLLRSPHQETQDRMAKLDLDLTNHLTRLHILSDSELVSLHEEYDRLETYMEKILKHTHTIE